MTTAVDAAIVAALDHILRGWVRDEHPNTSYPLTEYVWTANPQRVVCVDQGNGKWTLPARVRGGEFLSGSDMASVGDVVGVLRLLIGELDGGADVPQAS